MDRQIRMAVTKSLATHVAVLLKLKKEIEDLKFDLSILEHENEEEMNDLAQRYENEISDVSKYFTKTEMKDILRNSTDYNPFIPNKTRVTDDEDYLFFSNLRKKKKTF